MPGFQAPTTTSAMQTQPRPLTISKNEEEKADSVRNAAVPRIGMCMDPSVSRRGPLQLANAKPISGIDSRVTSGMAMTLAKAP